MKEKKISDLLIGNKGSSNSNKLSTIIVGNLKDKDRDGYPMGFSNFVDDCNDKDKNKDGWMSNVVNVAKQVISTPANVIKTITQPKPTPAKTTTPSTSYTGSKLQQTIQPGAKTTITTPTPTATTSKPTTTTTRTSGGGSSGGGQTITQIVTPPTTPLTPSLSKPETKITIPSTYQVSVPNKSTINISPQMPSQDYSSIVKQRYEQEVANANITREFKIGDITKTGTYYTKDGRININPLYPFKESTTAHEIGHKVDFSEDTIRDYDKYKKSSANIMPDFIENLGYNKGTVKYEYYARAFENYIKEPTKFKQSNPEVAREFEKRLNIEPNGNALYIAPQVSKPQMTAEEFQTKVTTGEIVGMSIMPSAKEEAKKLLLAKGEFIPSSKQKSQAEFLVSTKPQPFKKPETISEAVQPAYKQVTVTKAIGLTGNIKEDYSKSTIGRVASGDIGQRIMGVTLPSGKRVTLKDVQTEVVKKQPVVALLIPTTPLDVALTVGLPGGLGYLSKGGKVARGIAIGADVGFTGLSGYQLTQAKTKEERILAGAGLGLGILGLTSTKGLRAAEVAESIQQAETKLVSKGFITTRDLSKYNLDEASKVKIESLMDSGYAVRESEISLVPKKGLEKTTPKVSGKVLELINQRGDVAERIAVSRDVKIELGRKKVTQDIYAETLLKVGEEGNIKGITDVVTRTKQQKVIGIGEQAYPKNKISISRLTEETKQIGQTGKDKTQVYYTETKTGLLQREKFTGQPTILKQFAKQKIETPKQEFVTSYHGTTSTSAEKVLTEGLTSAKETGLNRGVEGIKLEGAFTTPEKSWAESWSRRAVYGKGVAKKGEVPVVLEVKLPKKLHEELLLKSRQEKGGGAEFIYKNVPPQYIKVAGQKTTERPTYLQILPDFEAAIKKSTPKSISRSIEVQKQTSTKGLRLGGEEGFLIGEKFYQTKGKSVSINIREVPQVSKPQKPFRIVEEAIKTSKEYKAPEVKLREAPQILEKQKPTYVGGESTQSSLLYGKGGTKGIIREAIYETAPQFAQRDLTGLRGKSSVLGGFNIGVQAPMVQTKVSTGQGVQGVQAFSLLSGEVTKQEEQTKEVDKTLLRTQSDTVQLFQPATKEDTLLKEGLKQTQKLKQEQRQLLRQRPTQAYPRTSTPMSFKFIDEIPTPRYTYPTTTKKKTKTRKKFITEIRRRGTFTPVGEASTLGQAFGMGVSRVKQSLAASFRVREAGKKEAVKFNLNMPEFRQAKREEGVVVQKSSKRLSSIFEVREILASRKKSFI